MPIQSTKPISTINGETGAFVVTGGAVVVGSGLGVADVGTDRISKASVTQFRSAPTALQVDWMVAATSGPVDEEAGEKV